MTTTKLDSTGYRWLASLANFDFEIQYRPGFRTRTQLDYPDKLNKPNNMSSISDVYMKALCQFIQLEIPFVENLSVDSELVN